MVRNGIGIDVHQLVPGDHLILGGVTIPSSVSSHAHSDGDVVLHALCDALLGAAALGDIGQHFPDSDPRWFNAPSSVFVEYVMNLLQKHSLRVVNVDISIVLEHPKIAPYRASMCRRIAELCKVEAGQVSIKATTSEGIGFVGRGEGIVALCVCTLVST